MEGKRRLTLGRVNGGDVKVIREESDLADFVDSRRDSGREEESLTRVDGSIRESFTHGKKERKGEPQLRTRVLERKGWTNL